MSGPSSSPEPRLDLSATKFTDRDETRAKIFADLVSMPIQLKYLIVENFQCLVYVIEHKCDHLRKNALHTVQFAEFSISSCNFGTNEAIHTGKHLVPFLSTYMPNLQTLRLWRPDDFPWTSIRPNFKYGYYYGVSMGQWQRTLNTPQSINEHVAVFEQDLSQLFEQLKQLVYLDIHGDTSSEKIEPYRLMVQTRFPNSQIDIQISRFRLWM
ncbi:unnamed protein product [Rotaria sp. Silwood2]|nr:unnamed protein product [Rotaria sp. Silwood2]CAF4213976.1 unnamed protein product [Rotaria sp. Silwood2]